MKSTHRAIVKFRNSKVSPIPSSLWRDLWQLKLHECLLLLLWKGGAMYWQSATCGYGPGVRIVWGLS